MVSWAHILLPPLSLLICLSVLCTQIAAVLCYWRKYSNTIDTIFVISCVIICFFSNTLQCIIGILLETALPNCGTCLWAPLFTQLLYITTRLFVYLFYLQRARLAQSFNPIIPNYYFTKIFPIIFFISYISIVFLFYFKEGSTSECVSTGHAIPSRISKQWCQIQTPLNAYYFINIGALIEIIVTIFFGYLFVSPLLQLIISNEKLLKIEQRYQANDTSTNRLSIFDSFGQTPSRLIPRRNTSHSSISPRTDVHLNIANNTRYIQTIELKRALFYNVIFSILSLIASVCTMIIWPISPVKYFYIPYCDYIVNSVTTFIMLGRNRKFIFISCHKICIKYQLYCCCTRNNNQRGSNSELFRNIAAIDGLNDCNNNINGMNIQEESDDSVLSATDTYFQHRRLLNLSHRSSIPNYQSTECYA